MAKPALWPRVRAAMAIFFYACCTVGALAFADHAVGRRGLGALRQLYVLSRLPEQKLGATWASPALVQGTLHTEQPRESPSGRPSAIWYAWVEDVRGSGRNARTVVVCDANANSALELRQAARTARLELLDTDEKGALLKGGALESLPLDQVALDFGVLYKSPRIPEPMRERCRRRLPASKNLTYVEAAVPLGAPVTVVGCASDTTVYRCGRPPGVISVRGMRHVLRAYANQGLDPIRGAAGLTGVALCLLASALFRLRAAGSAS